MDLIDWTKLPSLTSLRAFEAVAQSESFSAAGRSLNVTHAAVAQQVKSLEDHLGVSLVRRSPRGVVLTSDGQALAASLRSGFTAIAEGINALQKNNLKRPVRVTTTCFFAESVIFSRIASFWQDHPDTEVSFTPSDLPLDLVAEGFDLAVRAGEGEWPGLISNFLLDSPTLAFAAPSLVDDEKTDWSKIPWLFPHDGAWEREALQQSGIDTDKALFSDVGNPALEIRAGEQGMGLVLESEIDVMPKLKQGTLKIAPIPISHTSSYFIVTPPWPPRPTVQQFIDWMQDTCRDIQGASGRA